MGRPKSSIWHHFQKLRIKNREVISCKYCSHHFNIPNSFRMERHLVNICRNCPAPVKETFQKKHTRIQKCAKPEHVPFEASSASNAHSTPSPFPDSTTVCDPLSAEENEVLQEMMSLAVIVTTRSFSMFEHPLWREFFKRLRPTFKLPTQKMITSTYLSVHQDRKENSVQKEIEKSSVLHMQCDGWSNIRNEGTINFVINKPEPVLVRSLKLNPRLHTGTVVANELEKVLETYGAFRFCVLIGDNGHIMQNAFDKISEKFPNVVPLACIAHTLNLLCADIAKVTHVAELIRDVSDLVNAINSAQIHKNSLQNIDKTRWGSTEKCLTSVLKNKSAILRSIATNPKVKGLSTKFILLILDQKFWKKVEQLDAVFKPITDLIAKVETEKSVIHNVYSWFSEAEIRVWDELSKLSILSKNEQDNIKISFLARKKASVSKMHLAAVVLNPLDQGASLLPSEELSAVEYIHSLYKHMNPDMLPREEDEGIGGDVIVTELSNYKSKVDLWSKEFLWKNAVSLSPLVWWKSFFIRTALGKVAIAVLSAPVTSAVPEK